MRLFINSKVEAMLMHILLWIGVWFFFIYFLGYNTTDKIYVKWFSGFLLPLTMMVTYFVVYFLIPRYLLTKKYFHFSLYSFYTLVFSSYIIVLIIYGCLIFLLRFDISIMPPMSKNFIFVLILVFIVVGMVSFISLLNQNFKALTRNKELQTKILETQLQLKDQELHYLKMQIHPHFLFNTLNTIYGFALKQSKQTPEIILMLSNLLDYILYQINKPRVSLSEEILHIKEYIELEKIRFQDTLKVSFTLVENAFKHGDIIDGFLSIEIRTSVINNSLSFTIRNTILDSEPSNENAGIGLTNLRKQLDLNYPNNHKVNIELKDNWYIVNLSIFDLNAVQNA